MGTRNTPGLRVSVATVSVASIVVAVVLAATSAAAADCRVWISPASQAWLSPPRR
jgi:hypothetical protein